MICIDCQFAELYGIILGDGCISHYTTQNKERYDIRIDGHATSDKHYYQEFLIPLIKKITQRTVTIHYRKDCHGIFIKFQSKYFALFLNNYFSFPLGKKQNIFINHALLRESQFRRAILRGFFDTDGSLYFTKNNTAKIRNYPIIELSTHSRPLLFQLSRMLSDEGFTPVISFYKDSVKLHGRQNFINWFELIGSHHPEKLSKYLWWWNHYSGL